MIDNVACTIQQRQSAQGHPFSEILYTFTENGEPRNACTRLWHPIPDTDYSRGQEIANFKRRQARAIS